MLFKSKVEVRPQVRRASKLITIVVPPMKAKKRTLMLTTQRLLCVKIPAKGRALSVKAEFTMLSSDIRKDSVMAVISVEPKGEKEFVVMTVGVHAIFVVS
jgi:3-phosphoinositide dependent protein kinase-1